MLLITGAAAATSTGAVIAALEARRAPAALALHPTLLAGVVRRPLWRIAAGLDVLGWVLRTAALMVAPLTLVAPGMAVGLLILLGLSAVVLGERAGPQALTGVATLGAGVLLVVIHAPERSVSVASPGTWAVCVFALACGASLAFIARANGRDVDARLIAMSAGFAWALNAVLAKLLADAISEGRTMLAAGAVAATVAVTVTAYLAKTSALQSGPATVVESVIAVVNTMVPVALAPLLFGETWSTDPQHTLTLATGILLVGIGVWALSRSSARLLADAPGA
ncbi:MAG: DMT family transporter [Thermoleophilia bacterium]|nr:DMT family transporter [Thermoleophilia bacterium]